MNYYFLKKLVSNAKHCERLSSQYSNASNKGLCRIGITSALFSLFMVSAAYGQTPGNNNLAGVPEDDKLGSIKARVIEVNDDGGTKANEFIYFKVNAPGIRPPYTQEWYRNPTAYLTHEDFHFRNVGLRLYDKPLNFSNKIDNRRIVLWSDSNNPNQFYGFGINNFTLRYQVDNTQSSHVFYAGKDANTSVELLRVHGDGTVGIPSTGKFANMGTGIFAGPVYVGNTVKVFKNNVLEFGDGITGKEGNAGKIGYQVFDKNALDIVGAGTSDGKALRRITLWAEGGTTLKGGLQIEGKNFLELGAGVAAKEGNAGRIGYQLFGGSTALDIVGAGTADGKSPRRITLWAEGGTEFKGGAVFNDLVSFNKGISLKGITNLDGLNIPASGELNMGNGIINRRIVLWDNTKNANQFYGFGISGGTLRYQIEGAGSSHVFYAGKDAANSTELLRIAGNGDVTSTGKMLLTSGSLAFVNISQKQKDVFNLFVEKGVLSEDYAIAPKASWADYVFSNNYERASLTQIAAYIQTNGHLPGIPSAATVKAEGYDLHSMNTKFLEKIEELTLHAIDQQKEIESLKSQLQAYKAIAEKIEKLLAQSESKKN